MRELALIGIRLSRKDTVIFSLRNLKTLFFFGHNWEANFDLGSQLEVYGSWCNVLTCKVLQKDEGNLRVLDLRGSNLQNGLALPKSENGCSGVEILCLTNVHVYPKDLLQLIGKMKKLKEIRATDSLLKEVKLPSGTMVHVQNTFDWDTNGKDLEQAKQITWYLPHFLTKAINSEQTREFWLSLPWIKPDLHFEIFRWDLPLFPPVPERQVRQRRTISHVHRF